jgi:hypothetical protein
VNNKSCFGLLYSSEARECQDFCQVREECKSAMEGKENVEGQVTLPCFKTYDEVNYACNTACKSADRCKEATAAKLASVELSTQPLPVVSTEPEPPTQPLPVVSTEPEPPTQPLPVVSTEPEPPTQPLPVVSTEPEPPTQPLPVVSTEPELPTQEVAPVGVRVTRKGLLREIIRSGKKVDTNDLVQALVDAGFVLDTDAARKSVRDRVHLIVSEFRKTMNINKEGQYYVYTGDK